MENNDINIKNEKKIKYTCDKCNFKCNTKARWEAHINTELHKTGQRKKRTDCKEPTKCEKCDYKTKNRLILEQHILNEHSTLEEREKGFKHYCKICDYGSISKDLFERHLNTDRHKINEIRHK